MEMEIVPKPKVKPSRIIAFLLFFSLIALILAVGAYFYLKINLDNKNKELAGFKDALKKKETSRELEKLQSDLSIYKEKIDTISFLFDSYRLGTNFFKFIEEYTHPAVQWSNVGVSLLDYKTSLAGKTDNYTSLIQQLYILEGNPNIKDLTLSSFSTEKGKGVDFNLSFSLPPSLFKF